MLRKIGRFAVPLAAIAVCLCVTQLASATTVNFYTTGSFDNTATDSVTVNGYTITFAPNTGDTANVTPTLPKNVDLGSFVVTAVGSSTTVISEGFTLNLYQTAPTNDSGVFTGTLTGTLIINGGGMSIDLDPDSYTFDSVTYTLRNDPSDVNADVVGATSDIRAVVSTVPLPAAAWAGMALFGVLGVPKLRRWGQPSDEL